MKKIVLGTLCLLVAACSVEKPCYRENCFVTETKISADMQKIRSILMEYLRTSVKKLQEYDLKYVQVVCKLFGKDNKQLNKEIDKLQKFYQSKQKTKESKKLRDDLKKSLKGLKLDYKQLILLAKEMEADYAKISKEHFAKFTPYKARALEIVKYIDNQDHKKDEWISGHYEDGLNWITKLGIYYKMRSVLDDNYNKFDSYSTLLIMLENFISENILVDSFLKNHPSSVSPKDESSLGLYFSLYSLTPPTTKDGRIIFDAARKAVSNKKISKQDLADLAGKISSYLKGIASTVVKIQNDVTDKIDHDTAMTAYRESKLNNFYDYIGDRYTITNLVDKNPLKSKSYLHKKLSRTKYFSQLFIKKVKNLYEKLTFIMYDRIGGVGSRATHRVCNLLLWIQKSCTNRKFNLLGSKGSILIEFAVCMPVLIILLYYINDLSKLKRWHDQTEFVAQQAVNMIQNISLKRAQAATTEDQRKSLRRISKQDLQHIHTLATLTIYPDNNFCSIYRGHKHGHFGEIFLHYIKGNDDGTADVVWRCMVQMYQNGITPSAIGVNDNSGSLNGRSRIKIQKGVSPQEIWPTLKMGPEDKEKIILEFCVDYTNTSSYKLGNGDGCNTVSPSKIFGFNLVKPKGTAREDTKDFAYFNSVVIFTPRSGLFDETPPQ